MLKTLILIFFVSACATTKFKSGRYVEVLPGDNLKSMAKEFQVSPEDLTQANQGVEFVPGQWVFIPDDSGVLNDILQNASAPGWFKSSVFSGFSKTKFNWPVPGSSRISSGYGMRRRNFHEGIDIPAPRGTAIHAAEDGKVVFSGRKIKGYGNLTIIAHDNGYFTVYGHASKNFTKVGDKVTQGQEIATVGSTGRSTGPHLHFEVRHYDRSIDPLHFLNLPSGAEVAKVEEESSDEVL